MKTNNFEFPSQFNNVESPKEQKFIDIIKDGVIKIDNIKYSDRLFLFKDGNLLFEYNLKNGYIYFNYELIWSVFQRKYSMEYQQIRRFLKKMMAKHFNCKDVNFGLPDFFTTIQMEKHFNCKS